MLKFPRLYTPENVERARYAQIAVAVIAVAVSGYLVFTAMSSVRQVWSAKTMLSKERLESGSLSRQIAALRRQEAKLPHRSDGGVEMFALQLSRWATEQGVRVEAMTPQGTPVESEVTVGSANLGTWNAVQVRVEGHGPYTRVVDLLGKFRHPGMPVQLDSFAFQSTSGGDSDVVTFDLMLTVYERKAGTSQS